MRTLVMILVAVLAFAGAAFGGDRMATVSGYCYLMDAADHSGTKVLFEAQSPSSVTDSTYTDLTGYYQIGLNEGIYQVSCRHVGYIPHVFGDAFSFGAGSHALPNVTLRGPAVEVSGAVSGEWLPEPPFYVAVGDIWVNGADSLMIHPGVTVLFAGDYDFTVGGRLDAVGTATDSVVFASAQSPGSAGDWRGLRLEAGSGGVMEHCGIKHMQTNVVYGGSELTLRQCTVRRSLLAGVSCSGGTLLVEECLLDSIGQINAAISGSGSIVVRNTTVRLDSELNAYSAIEVGSGDSAIIEGNLLIGSGNQWGIDAHGFGGGGERRIRGNVVQGFEHGIGSHDWGGEVAGNLVLGCTQDGITVGGDVSVLGNTIIGCGTGLYVNYGPDVLVRDNVTTANGIGVYCYSSAVIDYNDVWGNGTDYAGGDLPFGIGDLVTVNANGDSCDAYFNISLDPLFVGAEDYHLQAGSPCIDAGNPDSTYYDPDGTIADMGAFPYYQGAPAAPQIDFMPSGTCGTSPYPVQFTSSNVGGPITTWSWSFGDGGTSGLVNPVHTYVVSDTTSFTVALSVEGPGGSDAVVYPDLITVLPAQVAPHADFTAEPRTGYGPVQFTDLSLGQIGSWEWSFGNGDSSSQRHPYHEYSDPDTYTVTLTVTGPYGSDVEQKVDYIAILSPETVLAGFEASVTSGVAPLPVWFTNTTTGTVTSYAWDFGDSATSSDIDPVHIYADPGAYDVVLVATGPANSDTASATIEVLSAEPVITSIDDVPDDQGSQVYVRFSGSGYDTNSPRSAENYTVERRDDGLWIAVASGSAYGQATYIYLTPTLEDSVEGTGGLTEFRVVAAMDEGSFLSESAWGYSVDNIAPGLPGGFVLEYHVPGGNRLSWDSCPDEDFQYFRVYRSTDPEFTPGPENLVYSAIDTQWLDGDGTGWDHYKITALDHAGNESDPASPGSVTGVDHQDVPERFALYQIAPNPAKPTTTICYDVPSGGGKVTLEIFDTSGRLVRRLAERHQTPGRKVMTWDGRDGDGRSVASGVYYYRLRAPGYERTLKMTVLK